MLKVMRVEVGHNEILTHDPHLCVSLRHYIASSNELIYECRDWLRDCISSGVVQEIQEVRRYKHREVDPNLPQNLRRRVLTYVFDSESDAMAFRLAFSHAAFKEPEHPYFRHTPWVDSLA